MMVMKKVAFTPRADVVVMEIGKRENKAGLIHLPDTAKKKQDTAQLIVVAVGPEVKHFSPGDDVWAPPNGNVYHLDIGDGVKDYMFAREEEVWGTFGV